MEGHSIETIKQMVASGLGLSILPRHTVTQNGFDALLNIIPIPKATRDSYLIWRVSYSRVHLIDRLIEILQHIYIREE